MIGVQSMIIHPSTLYHQNDLHKYSPKQITNKTTLSNSLPPPPLSSQLTRHSPTQRSPMYPRQPSITMSWHPTGASEMSSKPWRDNTPVHTNTTITSLNGDIPPTPRTGSPSLRCYSTKQAPDAVRKHVKAPPLNVRTRMKIQGGSRLMDGCDRVAMIRSSHPQPVSVRKGSSSRHRCTVWRLRCWDRGLWYWIF